MRALTVWQLLVVTALLCLAPWTAVTGLKPDELVPAALPLPSWDCLLLLRRAALRDCAATALLLLALLRLLLQLLLLAAALPVPAALLWAGEGA
jgi:hypothetical protein